MKTLIDFSFSKAAVLGAALALATVSGVAVAGDSKQFNITATYKEECGSCHIAYPPQLLSRESWRVLMAGLDDHFGSDASLDAVKTREVTAYLESNAAGRADKFAAPGNLRVSQTPWFRKEHRDGHDGLTLAMWTSPAVKSPANCGACHTQAERGDYSENGIRLPR